MAVTDHNAMGGIPDAYLAAKGSGIKFIAGCEVYYNDKQPEIREQRRLGITLGGHKSKDDEYRDEYVRNRHVTILTANQTGYQNLIRMMTESWEIGFYYKPRTWFEHIVNHRDGLIVLSGCLNGPICHCLRKGDTKKALQYLVRFKEAFAENFYVEVQMPGPDLEDAVPTFLSLMRFAKKTGTKTVLTNDCHYLKREDFPIQKLLMAIEQNLMWDDPNLFHVNSDEQFMKTRSELRKTFLEQGYAIGGITQKDFEDACDNTIEVASRCTGFKPDTSLKLPTIPDADKELTKLILLGLRRIGKQDDPVYLERTKKELRMILEKGFSSYFLITKDLIDHSRSIGYEIGPGRGSVGGSLVAYLTEITTIDPIIYKLNFERFISPSRGGNLLKVTMT
jgi:DNA polymerase-3 subunit alpha